MGPARDDIPDWLATSERYLPASDRDGFIRRNLLALSSTLQFFRLDDGAETPLSPSPVIKLLLAVGCILLVSLARNYLFVTVVLTGVLLRACLLPRKALARVASGSCAAAGLTLALMAPAVALGQAHAPLLLATKSLVSVAVALTVALTTPAARLTRALRTLGVPGVAILTLDLALRSIVRLGETAAEVLCALRLRSVGRNPSKRTAMGGVGGVVLLKASRAAQDTYDAMRCRGFTGTYELRERGASRAADALWCALFALLFALFLYLQGTV